MKAINVVFGFVIFVLVLTMMFAAIADMMIQNNIDGADTFVALSGDYEGFTNQFDEQGNAISRQIIDGTKQGVATSEDKDVSLLSGALSGGRLVTSFFGNFDNIIHNATANANTGESYIDNRIINGILALIVIFVAFVVLHFLRGFKTET